MCESVYRDEKDFLEHDELRMVRWVWSPLVLPDFVLADYNLYYCNEKSSQHQHENKRKRAAPFVCSSSAGETQSIQFDSVASTHCGAEKGLLCTFDSKNSVTLRRHMEDTTAINSCMYYFGGASTYCHFYVEMIFFPKLISFLSELCK